MTQSMSKDKVFHFLAIGFTYPPVIGNDMRLVHLMRLIAQDHRLNVLACSEYTRIEDPEGFAEISASTEIVQTGDCWTRSGTRIATLMRDLLDRRPRALRGLDCEPLRTRVRRLAEDPSVVVWADRLWMSLLFLGQPERRCTLVCDWHDIESIRTARHLFSILSSGERRPWLRFVQGVADYLKIRRLEAAVVKSGCAVVVASQKDQNLIRRRYGGTCYCIPNGVSTLGSKCPDGKGSESVILLPGTLNYAPNEEGALWLIKHVWPAIHDRTAAVLVVAGRSPTHRLRQACEEGGVVLVADPPDMGPLFKRSRIVVVPIFSGSGTRIKILDALNHGRGVVSTTIGAEGLDLRDEEHLLIRDNASEFADACIDLLSDTAWRRALAKAGWCAVSEKYTWDSFRPQLDAMFSREIELQTAKWAGDAPAIGI